MRNLVWSFAPWFVFLIAAHIATLEFAIAAGVVAAVIVYGRAVVDDRVYLLDVAGVIYFLGLGVALLVDPVIVNDWGPYAQLGSHALLTVIVFGSILVGHPFSEAYARETTPRALWTTPEFHAVNRRISAVWGLAFLVGTLSLWAATTSVESRPVLLHVIVPLGALYLAFKYTTASQSSRDTSIATAQGSRG